MLLLGQREINQHTLAMKWRNARIILRFIIVYLLRRFFEFLQPTNFHAKISKYFVFRATLWIGTPKKLSGTVSFQTKFLG